MEFDPVDNEDVVQVATPEVSVCAVQPVMDVLFAVKPTVPVGVPPLELTLALKVTEAPDTLGFNDE